MATKYNLTRQYKQALGQPCAYCSRPMQANDELLWPTKDHVHPRSKGGREKVWACWICNNIKGDMTLAQWRRYMDAHPRWWMRESRPTEPPVVNDVKREPDWLMAQAELAVMQWPWLRDLYRPMVRQCGWNWKRLTCR